MKSPKKRSFISVIIKQYPSVIFIGLFVLVSLIYILIQGENIVIPIHDYLDSHPARIRMIVENGLFFDNKAELPMLGGSVTREDMYSYSYFKLYSWLFYFLPVFWAVIAGWYLKILFSIAGFYYFFTGICEKERSDINIVLFCGFLYGIIPSFPPSAFCFASLPFLAGLIVRLYGRFSPKCVLALFLYPVVSFFSTFGIFICAYLFLIILVDLITKRRFNKGIFAGLAALASGYVINEWHLFSQMLFGAADLTRQEIETDYKPLKELVDLFLKSLIDGQYHAAGLQKYVVLPVCVILLLYTVFCHIRKKEYKAVINDKVNILFCVIILNCILYALNYSELFKGTLSILLPPLAGFNYTRAIWLNPVLWYLLFAILLGRLPFRRIIPVFLAAAFLVLCFAGSQYNSIKANIDACKGRLKGEGPGELTYKEFYSEDLFERIKQDTGYRGEWSAAYGMHPAILEYSNISTLDGYYTVYKKEYKEKFRNLIKPDLDIDEKNADYYDG